MTTSNDKLVVMRQVSHPHFTEKCDCFENLTVKEVILLFAIFWAKLIQVSFCNILNYKSLNNKKGQSQSSSY